MIILEHTEYSYGKGHFLMNEHLSIGSGPDTFAVRFMDKYTEDVRALGELSINDTAANVYITMLINIGMVGLAIYLLYIFLQLKDGLRRKNNYSFVLLIAILCYWIQDFFNLWVVIVVPVFWTLMAIHQLALNKDTKVLKDGGITNESEKEK